MISRTLLTGLLAGVMAGAALTVLYLAKAQPLILQAELLEHGAAGGVPESSLARTFDALLFNLLTGVAFGLILSAIFALRGRPVGPRRGLAWGAAGFAVFALAPAFSLPPELPGMIAAPIDARQLWWLLTVTVTAGGMGLLAFDRGWPMRLGGLALILLPHFFGAPQPVLPGGTVPAHLAAQFVAVSLGSSAVFWLVLGVGSGYLFDRFGLGRRTATAPA